MAKFRLGIDIDGVLFPWADASNQACMVEFGIPDPGPHTTWDHLQHSVTPEQYKWAWTPKGMRKIFGLKMGYPGVEVFKELLDHPDLECHFVTHRAPAVLTDITGDFLHWLFPDSKWEGLHITKGTDKTEILEWDFFIDDKPETVKSFLQKTPAETYMPIRPWNKSFLGEFQWSPRFNWYNSPSIMVADILGRVAGGQ